MAYRALVWPADDCCSSNGEDGMVGGELTFFRGVKGVILGHVLDNVF